MSLLWVGKWVDQKAEGGLMQKGQRSVEGGGSWILSGTSHWGVHYGHHCH